MKTAPLPFFVMLSALAFPASPVFASPSTWQAAFDPGVCFSISAPTKTVGSLPGRATPALAVTDHLKEGLVDTVTVGSGFADADGASATIAVDKGEAFPVLLFNGVGFVEYKLEKELVAGMVTGRVVTFTLTTPSGRSVVDTYDLRGFNDARKKMKGDCHRQQ